jgi:hypothetical protein
MFRRDPDGTRLAKGRQYSGLHRPSTSFIIFLMMTVAVRS